MVVVMGSSGDGWWWMSWLVISGYWVRVGAVRNTM